MLSRESEVIARGDEIEVVKKEGDELETIVINSTLKKELFLAAIGLPKDAIKWEKTKKRNDKSYSSICDVRFTQSWRAQRSQWVGFLSKDSGAAPNRWIWFNCGCSPRQGLLRFEGCSPGA